MLDPLAQDQATAPDGMAELAGDPSVDPAILAQLAHSRPDLQETIARNPATYDALLQWMMQYGTPAASAIALQRWRATSQPDGYRATLTSDGSDAMVDQAAQGFYASAGRAVWSEAGAPAPAGYGAPVAYAPRPARVRPVYRPGFGIDIALAAVAAVGSFTSWSVYQWETAAPYAVVAAACAIAWWVRSFIRNPVDKPGRVLSCIWIALGIAGAFLSLRTSYSFGMDGGGFGRVAMPVIEVCRGLAGVLRLPVWPLAMVVVSIVRTVKNRRAARPPAPESSGPGYSGAALLAPGGAFGYGRVADDSTNGFAIASMVIGILGGSVLGLVFGYVARSQIKQTGQRGNGMAIAGIVLGWFWVAVLIGLIVFMVVVGFRLGY